MNILNFIPLLIWSLAFPLVAFKIVEMDDCDYNGLIYLIGCVIWLLIGCAC